MADKSVSIRWDGGLRFDASSELGGTVRISGDEGMAGLRPSETLLVALGTCAGADVASILAKKRQPLEGYVIEVSAVQRAEHPRSFLEIDVLHLIEGEWVEAEAIRRSIELSVTSYCPVTAQLSSGDVTIRHRYRLGAPGRPEIEVAQSGPHGRIVVFSSPPTTDA